MADTVKKLSVKFEGDTKKLNTAIKDATEGFNDISKAAKNLDSQFEKFGTEYARTLWDSLSFINKDSSIFLIYNP